MNRLARSLAAPLALSAALALPGGAAAPLAAQAEAAPLTLDEALDAALATHPTLERAAASADAASAGVGFARAAWLPTLSVSGITNRFEEPMVVAPLHGFDPTMPPSFDRTLVQGRVEADYTLFEGGARGARIAAAEAGRDAALTGVRVAREEVLLGVTSTYARTHAAESRLAAAEARVASATSERERAERMVAEGAAAEVERIRADAALASAEAELASERALVDVARRELARWMGVEPAALEGRSVAGVAVGPAGAALAGGAPGGPGRPGVSGESAAVERAGHAARAAEAAADAARATRLPRLDLRAGLVEYGSAEGDFQGEWQAGVSLAFPVFTGGARGADIDRASAEARSARAAVEVARLDQASAVDRWSASLVAALERGRALAESVTALTEVERIEALALREGAGVQRDLLSAQADLFQARAALADATAEQTRAALELGRAQGALGRDWITRTLEATP